MKPDEIRRDLVDVEAILDMLVEHQELYLTIREADVKTVKQRLSQAKFKRGEADRLSMREGRPFTFHPVRQAGTDEDITPFRAVDLHLKLGTGADIFVVACRAADDTL